MFGIRCIIIHGYPSDFKLSLHKMVIGCRINIDLKMQNRYKLQLGRPVAGCMLSVQLLGLSLPPGKQPASPQAFQHPKSGPTLQVFSIHPVFFKGKVFNSFNKDCSVPVDQRMGLDLSDLLAQIYTSLYIYICIKFFHVQVGHDIGPVFQ